MRNPKDDNYYLEKILDDIDFLLGKIEGKTYEEVTSNLLLVDSIMFRLIQIAENSDKLSSGFKFKYSYVKWAKMKGMRNRIVHGYDEEIDTKLIYETVINYLPIIRDIVIKELKK